MADGVVNPRVAQQRLKTEIAAQESAVASQTLAILEMAERKVRHLENIAAARRVIAEKRESLRALDAEHGPLTDGALAELIAFVDGGKE